MTGSVEIVAVVAMANNRVIGDGNSLIWHLPDDLKRVKALTMGCPLIMGRRTWDSIGRPLPGRASIVMTRDADWAAEGALRAGNLDMAVTLARDWMAATADARDERPTDARRASGTCGGEPNRTWENARGGRFDTLG